MEHPPDDRPPGAGAPGRRSEGTSRAEITWSLLRHGVGALGRKLRYGSRGEAPRHPLLSGTFATTFYSAVNGRAPREEALGELVGEYRTRFPALGRQLRAVGAAMRRGLDPATVAATDDEIATLYDERMMRPPDERSLAGYRARVAMGLADAAQVRRELEQGEEYRTVVQPLLAEIHRIYRTFVLRDPSPTEVQEAFDRFRTCFETLEAQRETILAGEAKLYLGIRPLKLEIDISTQCNLRCVMCYLSVERFSKRERIDLSLEDFERIAEQILPYCSHLSLSIGTEPLLNQHCEDMIAVARRYRVPWVYMNTNALLLDEARIERLVETGLHGCAVSIDAATAETYERVRKGGRFERLISNLHALNAAKQRHGSRYPVVTFNFVMMRSNVHELPALVELARDLEVEGIAAFHMVPVEGLDRRSEALHTERDLCNRMLAEAGELARRHDIEVSFPEPFTLNGKEEPALKASTPVGFQLNENFAPTRSRCKFPWVFVGIDPYGSVNPCGWWFRDPPMGNALTDDFASIWNSGAYVQLRREHMEGHLRETCRNCPAAGMGSVNDPAAFLEARLGDTPPVQA